MYEDTADYSVLEEVDIKTITNNISEMGIEILLDTASITSRSDWQVIQEAISALINIKIKEIAKKHA